MNQDCAQDKIPSIRIPTYISSYKQTLNTSGKINNPMGAPLARPSQHSFSFEDMEQYRRGIFSTRHQYHTDATLMSNHQPIQTLLASDHISIASPFLSEDLISEGNFEHIQELAKVFPGNLTSFLGFECRLADPTARADFAFAISGVNGDRNVFVNLLQDPHFSAKFLHHPEWQQISNFAASWADPHSDLYENVKCFWLEFDMPENPTGIPVPSVFFGPAKPHGATNESTQYRWLTQTALPLLKGGALSETVEQKVMDCIEKIPGAAYLFQVGTMLSREVQTVRVYINRIAPDQIIPYLISIGWADDAGAFAQVIEEIADKADRFVISFDVQEDGIGSKIGIECSFNESQYLLNSKWERFLEYLVTKGLCLPEKRDALLKYSGVENAEIEDTTMKPLTSASRSLDEVLSSAIARFINHVKLVYRPGQPLEAKAYPAVRYFNTEEQTSDITKMTTA